MRTISSILFSATVLSASAQSAQPFVIHGQASDVRGSLQEADRWRSLGVQMPVITAPGWYVGLYTSDMAARIARLPGVADMLDATVAEQRLRTADRGSRERRALSWCAHYAHRTTRGLREASMPFKCGMEEAQATPGLRASLPPTGFACSNGHNSERMQGTIWVTTFFVESDGINSIYDWTQGQLDDAEESICDAWVIWNNTVQAHGGYVSAYMDFHRLPENQECAVPVEPIASEILSSEAWAEPIMTALGMSGNGFGEQMDAWNVLKRQEGGTDHACIGFVVCPYPGDNGFLADPPNTGGVAGFADLGGPSCTTAYLGGFIGYYAHEMGHVHHGFDEYHGSGTCGQQFNGEPNSNHVDLPCEGNEDCLMALTLSTVQVNNLPTWALCTHSVIHMGIEGTLAPVTLEAPLDQEITTTAQVHFGWDRNGAPSGVPGYLRVVRWEDGAEVFCSSVGDAEGYVLSLLDGEYYWTVAIGQPEANGYAGVWSEAHWFTVAAPVTAAAQRSTDQPICPGSTVTFTDISTGYAYNATVDWSWDFYGGTPDTWSGQEPPPVTYTEPGVHPIKLTVSEQGGDADQLTWMDAVTVYDVMNLPFHEDISGTTTGWGVNSTAQPGFLWEQDNTPSCGGGYTAPGYGWQGDGISTLFFPRLDLTQSLHPFLSLRYSYVPTSNQQQDYFRVVAGACGGPYTTIWENSGKLLSVRPGSVLDNEPWVPATCEDWHRLNFDLSAVSGDVTQVALQFQTPGGQNFYLDEVSVFEGLPVPVKVLLDGPYDPSTGLMSAGVRNCTAGFPNSEPFSGLAIALPADQEMLSFPLTTLNATGADLAAEWVIVELRDAQNPSHVVYARPALIQRDGDVVEMDGVQPPVFNAPEGEYYVAVRHRNHLGAMTASTIMVESGMEVVDFTDASTATYGSEARRTASNGKKTLWPGDVTMDHVIKYTGSGNDRDPILSRIGGVEPTNTVAGYYNEDVNLSGVVKYTGASNDRDPILDALGGNATQTRQEQLP